MPKINLLPSIGTLPGSTQYPQSADPPGGPMPAFAHGKAAKLYVNGYDVSPYLNKIGIVGKADTAEVSTLGTTDKQYLNGLLTATVQADGFNDDTNGAVTSVMGSAFTNGIDDIFTHLPQGDGFGKRAIGLVATVTDFEIHTDTSGVASVTVSGEADGTGRCPAVILHPISQEVGAAASAVVDNGAGPPVTTLYGLDSYLHVTQCTGGPLVVKVQHSPDNITFTDLCVHTAIVGGANVHAAERVNSVALAPTQIINRYLKSSWTITGSATFQHSAARLIHTH